MTLQSNLANSTPTSLILDLGDLVGLSKQSTRGIKSLLSKLYFELYILDHS